jgi:LysM repeat protein
LHFEVRFLGQPIVPSEIISFDNQQLLSDTYCLSKKTFDYVSAAKKAAAKNIASSKNKKGTKVHVVKKGDTLSAIARRYGTTTKVLCKKNGIKATAVLRLGQKIKI